MNESTDEATKTAKRTEFNRRPVLRKRRSHAIRWAPRRTPGQIDFDFDFLHDEDVHPSSLDIVSEDGRHE